MNLIFRVLYVLARLLRRSRLGPLDESVVRFRVLPNDLDVNLHMNNGRYLTLMDLGRLDLIGRMGVTRLIVKRRWRPVVGSLAIRFRRALAPFQTYELRSRVVCWDEKWFYLEQRFERRGAVIAVAVLKGLFLGPEGNVAPQEIIDRSHGGPVTSPPMPDTVAAWQAAEAELLSAS